MSLCRVATAVPTSSPQINEEDRNRESFRAAPMPTSHIEPHSTNVVITWDLCEQVSTRQDMPLIKGRKHKRTTVYHTLIMCSALNLTNMFTQKGRWKDDCITNLCLRCAAVYLSVSKFQQTIHLQKSFPHNSRSTNGAKRGSTETSSAVSNMAPTVIRCDRTGHELFWLHANPFKRIRDCARQTCFILSRIVRQIHLPP